MTLQNLQRASRQLSPKLARPVPVLTIDTHPWFDESVASAMQSSVVPFFRNTSIPSTTSRFIGGECQ
jgi:hypothetical protein